MRSSSSTITRALLRSEVRELPSTMTPARSAKCSPCSPNWPYPVPQVRGAQPRFYSHEHRRVVTLRELHRLLPSVGRWFAAKRLGDRSEDVLFGHHRRVAVG